MLEGITFYPGHVKDVEEQGRAALAQLGELLRSILADFRRAGMEIKIVSGGSTPSLFLSHTLPELTEIRPGTYVYNDLNTVRSGACALEDCAASILATVVSTAHPGQMIVDGGSKTFSSDRLANSSEPTFGHLVEAPGARFHKMNEEHGYIDLTPRRSRILDRGPRPHYSQPHLRGGQPARADVRPPRRPGGGSLGGGSARQAAIKRGSGIGDRGSGALSA